MPQRFSALLHSTAEGTGGLLEASAGWAGFTHPLYHLGRDVHRPQGPRRWYAPLSQGPVCGPCRPPHDEVAVLRSACFPLLLLVAIAAIPALAADKLPVEGAVVKGN